MLKCFYIIFLLFLIISCVPEKKSNKIPENLIFGHRGSGANVYNEKYIENTLPSVEFALENLDGCEVDIQMSADGTIWLYHDDMLGHFCDTVDKTALCIPTSKDSLIQQIIQCREGISDRIYTLDETFLVLSQPKYINKFLSLDVKGYYDSLCFPYRNAPESYFKKMAKELVFMVEKYDLSDQIILETGYTQFLDEVKKYNQDIRCHLIGYENFNDVADRALNNNYEGMSFSLYDSSITVESVKCAKEKGLEVQVWPINDSVLLKKAKAMKPFAMQISKLNFSKEFNSTFQE